MKTKAAVAFEPNKPLEIVELDLAAPRKGEVLVEIVASGVCHTDAYTLDGRNPGGYFPVVLGHEGAGIVREVGGNVHGLKPGDHVIPLYTPECRECDLCLHPKTNLCSALLETQARGVMPDQTSRFSYEGRPVYHYMGCSTFSNFTVVPEIALAKIRKDAPLDKVCYIGCGATTGIGAVIFTMKVEAGAIGNVDAMRQAMDACHIGWGESCVIGVDGNEFTGHPYHLLYGRTWKGTMFGGARGRTDVPKIVDWYMDGKIDIDELITRTLPLEKINTAFDLMHQGDGIRSVITY